MLSLRELQLLAEGDYTTESIRVDLGRIVQFFKDQPYHESAVREIFEKWRELPYSVAEDCDAFLVDDGMTVTDLPEDLRHESLGMVVGNHLKYGGRLVYPVKDVKGQVMGFCGWDPYEKPKYLDSNNSGYKAKVGSLYGMEKMPEYYSNSRPIYIVEGIVCCNYLRSKGFQALSSLGSYLTPYQIQILKRVEKRLVVIPDNDNLNKEMDKITFDAAGEHFVTQVKRVLPKAKVVQSLIDKDIDDSRKKDNHQYEEALLKDLKSIAENPFIKVTTLQLR